MATCLCMLLALFNLLYNNLLINLRFKAKMKSVTIGMCCFDLINFCICYCCLVKPCRDRCFQPWSLVKWALKAVIISVTVYLVWDKKHVWEMDLKYSDDDDFYYKDDEYDSKYLLELEKIEGQTNLDKYLIVYLL